MQNSKMVSGDNLQDIIFRVNSLRGLFAILIVIGHCSMVFDQELLPLYLIHKFNMVGVCFFLFVSGLSLTYNFYHKQGYLKHFLRNKVLYLFIVTSLSMLIGNILKAIILKDPLGWGIVLLTRFNWYIYEILIFYITFYLVYSKVRGKYYRELIILIVTLAVFFITIYFDRYGEWSGWTKSYYISCFSFLYGIVIVEHFNQIKRKFCEHNLIYSVALFLVGLGCCVSLKLPDSNWVGVLLKNLMGICIMSLVVEIVTYINPYNIPIIKSILSFLTERSLEIYLYQFCILDIVKRLYVVNSMQIDFSYVLVVVAGVCVISCVMSYLDIWVGGRVKRLP